MRGILTRKAYTSQKRRIITACAGNTYDGEYSLFSTKDHPRLRGEYDIRSDRLCRILGSSPLARGIRT